MTKTILHNCRIITGQGTLIEEGLIIINNVPSEGRLEIKDSLEFVGNLNDDSAPVPVTGEDRVYDLTGYTVLPGFVDTSVRLDIYNQLSNQAIDELGVPYRTLLSYRNAAEALNAGVTTLRCAGMPDDVDLALQNALAKFMMQGPSVISSGPEFIPHGGLESHIYGKRQCSGVNEFLGEARIAGSKGTKTIRIGITGDPIPGLGCEPEQQMKDDEIGSLVWLGISANKQVVARVTGDKATQKAVLAGVKCVEQSEDFSDITAQLMAENGVFYVPCICSAQDQDKRKRATALAHKLGVQVCLGTYMLPSEPVDETTSVVKEIELLTEAGLSPIEAIQAATINSARCIKSSAGLLEPGKPADLIAVKGKPDQNIRELRNISFVMKGGRLIWSEISGQQQRSFQIVPALFSVKGGSTNHWL